MFGFSRKARLHQDFARRYGALRAELEEIGLPDAQQWRSLRGRLFAIQAEEPPVLRVLAAICHNELCREDGEHEGKIGILRRMSSSTYTHLVFNVSAHKTRIGLRLMAGRPRTRYARLNALTCGAKTRKGIPCKCKALLRGGKCKFHGGMSTGAKTPEGKARQLAGRMRWLAEQRAKKAGLPTSGVQDGQLVAVANP